MRVLAQTPLAELRAEEKANEAKDAQLKSLGLSIAQEKMKNAQKDAQINQLGQELAVVKIEIAKLKGSAGK